jgi:NAD-dependent deacetylase
MDNLEKLQDIINKSNNIVFFGGAGVSTESGIPDFRSVDGIYNQEYDYPPETILSHRFFQRNTKEFYRFYKKKMICLEVVPNDAHKKLAELERVGKLKAIITQNIDGLHQLAGSKEVLELHGSVHRNYCLRCKKKFDENFIQKAKDIPICDCGGMIKPDVVLYEEGLNNKILELAVKYIEQAEVLIVGGTSLAVYPAAGLIDYYKKDKLILINKQATPLDYRANLHMNGNIGEILSNIRVQ